MMAAFAPLFYEISTTHLLSIYSQSTVNGNTNVFLEQDLDAWPSWNGGTFVFCNECVPCMRDTLKTTTTVCCFSVSHQDISTAPSRPQSRQPISCVLHYHQTRTEHYAEEELACATARALQSASKNYNLVDSHTIVTSECLLVGLEGLKA